jgi:hypothetical protein
VTDPVADKETHAPARTHVVTHSYTVTRPGQTLRGVYVTVTSLNLLSGIFVLVPFALFARRRRGAQHLNSVKTLIRPRPRPVLERRAPGHWSAVVGRATTRSTGCWLSFVSERSWGLVGR